MSYFDLVDRLSQIKEIQGKPEDIVKLNVKDAVSAANSLLDTLSYAYSKWFQEYDPNMDSYDMENALRTVHDELKHEGLNTLIAGVKSEPKRN